MMMKWGNRTDGGAGGILLFLLEDPIPVIKFMDRIFLAHPDQVLNPRDMWAAWDLGPAIVVPLVGMVLLYVWGARNLWRRAGTGHGISVRRFLFFLGAIIALFVALVSPLHALSDALFSAHMVQHLVLILVAAPLLVLSDVPLALLWALPRPWARATGSRLYHSQVLSRAWKLVSSPVSAWVLFTIALWAWHASLLFEAALYDETVHSLEHIIFLATGMLFWRVLEKHNRPKKTYYAISFAYLFTASLQSGILGALMTFSPQPWYSYYITRVAPWGLTPLQDQQLAGLIMWLPGGAVFTLLAIGYFGAWFRSLEQRSVEL